MINRINPETFTLQVSRLWDPAAVGWVHDTPVAPGAESLSDNGTPTPHPGLVQSDFSNNILGRQGPHTSIVALKATDTYTFYLQIELCWSVWLLVVILKCQVWIGETHQEWSEFMWLERQVNGKSIFKTPRGAIGPTKKHIFSWLIK